MVHSAGKPLKAIDFPRISVALSSSGLVISQWRYRRVFDAKYGWRNMSTPMGSAGEAAWDIVKCVIDTRCENNRVSTGSESSGTETSDRCVRASEQVAAA